MVPIFWYISACPFTSSSWPTFVTKHHGAGFYKATEEPLSSRKCISDLGMWSPEASGPFILLSLHPHWHHLSPAPQQRTLASAKQLSSQALGVMNMEAGRGAEKSKWANSLPGCLHVSLHSAFAKGKTFLVPSIKDDINLLWSKFQVQFLCFNFLCSDTSPSVHFIGLTHSENSEKCLTYWLVPFLLPRILINSLLCTYIFFCYFNEIWGWREANSYVSPFILNLKSILLISIFS